MLCKKALTKLKNYIPHYSFNSVDEEICFFKSIKPLFYSKYIYYINIYNFQIRKPTGGEVAVREYINCELSDLKRFFDHNQAFYQYYRSGNNQLDRLFFTRDGFDVYGEIDDFHSDELFSTSHDYKLSKIIATEKFQTYLNLQLTNPSQEFSIEKNITESPFKWTTNKTDLIELTYALVETGVFNNGNADIKNLVTFFQSVFQVDLRNYYHKYTDITNRKKERTVFLDKLKTNLLRRIDDKYELKEPAQRKIEFN